MKNRHARSRGRAAPISLIEMKTYKGLYEKIVSFENLHAAFRKAAKGKGLRADCAGFSYGREREILLLQEELQSGSGTPAGSGRMG